MFRVLEYNVWRILKNNIVLHPVGLVKIRIVSGRRYHDIFRSLCNCITNSPANRCVVFFGFIGDYI